jgi:hypothetical protein
MLIIIMLKDILDFLRSFHFVIRYNFTLIVCFSVVIPINYKLISVEVLRVTL